MSGSRKGLFTHFRVKLQSRFGDKLRDICVWFVPKTGPQKIKWFKLVENHRIHKLVRKDIAVFLAKKPAGLAGGWPLTFARESDGHVAVGALNARKW